MLTGYLRPYFVLFIIFCGGFIFKAKAKRKDFQSVFAPENGTHFSRILFDPDIAAGEVVVGGKEVLYRLDVKSLDVIEAADWKSPPETKTNCVRIKGKAEEECHNYITILMKHQNNTLLTCGTNSYQPKCSRRKGQDLNQVLDGQQEGDGRSPTSKNTPVAALVADNGDMYFGSSFPAFGGNKLGLYRFAHETTPWSPKLLKTNGNWFTDEAQFVDIRNSSPFLYFVFWEESLDKQRIISRIGRICANDIGDPSGSELEKYHWTTFQKATLECSVPSDAKSGLSTHFERIESVSYFTDPVSKKSFLAGIFSSPRSRLYGSALCIFEIDDIKRAFQGDYEPTYNSNGIPVHNGLPHFNCERLDNNMTVRDVKFSRSNYVMRSAVETRRPPVIVEEMTLFKFFQHEVLQLTTDRILYVFYVVTDKNEVRKYVVDPLGGKNRDASLVAVWRNLFKPLENVLTMKLIPDEHALLIGTSLRIVRLETVNCDQFDTENSCLSSGDPQCGWHTLYQRCTHEESHDAFVFLRSPLKLPSAEDYLLPWDESDWYSCPDLTNAETCRCRKRICISPKCFDIAASQIQVTNCSRSGGWSEFSGWSNCSVSCGTGKMKRTRTCTNPTPLHGGKPCQGLDTEEATCFVPPDQCPNRLLRNLEPQVSASRFLDWGPWSECTRTCGGGIQRRSRACVMDSSRKACDGPQKEVRECGMEACPVLSKSTSWTSWVSESSGKSSEYYEHRYQCVVTGDGNEMNIEVNHEERFCPNGDSCHLGQVFDGKLRAKWTQWSSCDAMGLSYRYQNCAGLQQKVCDKESAKVEEDVQWGPWSKWTACDKGKQDRFRVCLADSEICAKGHMEREYRDCNESVEENEISTAKSTAAAEFSASMIYLIVGCILAFFTGVGLTVSYFVVRGNKGEKRMFPRRRPACKSLLENRVDVEQNMYATALLNNKKDWQNGMSLHSNSDDASDGKDSGFNGDSHPSVEMEETNLRPPSDLERNGSTKRSFRKGERRLPARTSSFSTKANTKDDSAFS